MRVDELKAAVRRLPAEGLPDRFFTATQRDRLRELMDGKEVAANAGPSLTEEEHAELSLLIDAEVHAATARADSLLRELSP